MGGQEGTARVGWPGACSAGRTLAAGLRPLSAKCASGAVRPRCCTGRCRRPPRRRGRRRLGEIAGAWEEERPCGEGLRTPPAGVGRGERLATLLAGDASLGELVYGRCGCRPEEVVVETGVATGVTSAYLLAGLADNGRGTLHSVDLPNGPLSPGARLTRPCRPSCASAGAYPPPGASRRASSRRLSLLGGTVGLFVHDSTGPPSCPVVGGWSRPGRG